MAVFSPSMDVDFPWGSSIKGMPSASHNRVAFSIPPVEVGAPSSRIGLGLGSDWGSSNPFNENAEKLIFGVRFYRYLSFRFLQQTGHHSIGPSSPVALYHETFRLPGCGWGRRNDTPYLHANGSPHRSHGIEYPSS